VLNPRFGPAGASCAAVEHPRFRDHPDWYIWADEPPNNWLSALGGSAWSLDYDTGRYYLHSFYPEQPDLDWRNEEVRHAYTDVLAFRRGDHNVFLNFGDAARPLPAGEVVWATGAGDVLSPREAVVTR
jgi:hypothetical protein